MVHPSKYLKRHLDRFSRFCMSPKYYVVQCIVNVLMEKKTRKIVPSPWYFVTPPEEDQATAIGSMHN